MDDAAHATLLEVCEKADQIPRQDWAKWLMWRAVRRQIDYFRKDQRHAEFDEEHHASASDGTLESDPQADRRLHAALDQLSAMDRCVIEGRFFDDKDNATIQRDCGLPSANMVSKQVERALQRLKLGWGKSIAGRRAPEALGASRFGHALPPVAAPPIADDPAPQRYRSDYSEPEQDEGYASPAPSYGGAAYDPRQDDDD